MISVIRNPLGHKLSDNSVSGEATDSAGDVIITTDVNHGLSDGDYVYIESNIGTYNGFRYVDSISYTTFKIKESENGDYIPYKQDASVAYQVSVLNHGVQCVHLPIVYQLESSLSPNNLEEQDYVPNVVASFDNLNGNTRIVLTGQLSDPTLYSKIEIIGSGPLAGVYTIIQVLNESEVVIDLVYDAGYSFAGYTIVRYYDNYAINVNIYAGLYPGHRWETEKPIELIATLKIIPDENNQALFSISEYLRSKIKTLNDLTIDTFPNNLHFLTEFYVGYYESYDQSDSEEISTFTGEETLDSFVGQAINAKNEFKNLYSGHLSDYVSEGNDLAQWLTDFDSPIGIVGYFFDISFINTIEDDFILEIAKKLDDATIETSVETIDNPGKGVIRVTITPESGFDEFCVQVKSIAGVDAELFDLSTFTNFGSGEAWTLGAAPSISDPGPMDTQYLRGAFSGTSWNAIHLEIDSVTASGMTIRIGYMDAGDNVVGYEDITIPAIIGPQSFDAVVIPTGPYTQITIKAITELSVSNEFEITELSVVTPVAITEEICINILEECDSTLIGDFREIESGDLRLLE